MYWKENHLNKLTMQKFISLQMLCWDFSFVQYNLQYFIKTYYLKHVCLKKKVYLNLSSFVDLNLHFTLNYSFKNYVLKYTYVWKLTNIKQQTKANQRRCFLPCWTIQISQFSSSFVKKLRWHLKANNFLCFSALKQIFIFIKWCKI